MNPARSEEESLRELSCNGDLYQIRALFADKPDLNINSQNAMNGWTALHWAAKRNHIQVVQFLLEHGARRDVQSHDKSTPGQITSDDAIRNLLETSASNKSVPQSSATLPITPNYLRNPVFPYVSVQQTSTTHTPTITDSGFQPVILLCRVADDPSETDFVEFDFHKTPIDGSFERLCTTICTELDIDHIDKLRRLPCVRVRNDRDVERLKDNHMLEVILNEKTTKTENKTVRSSDE